jgi:hypothetical protein
MRNQDQKTGVGDCRRGARPRSRNPPAPWSTNLFRSDPIQGQTTWGSHQSWQSRAGISISDGEAPHSGGSRRAEANVVRDGWGERYLLVCAMLCCPGTRASSANGITGRRPRRRHRPSPGESVALCWKGSSNKMDLRGIAEDGPGSLCIDGWQRSGLISSHHRAKARHGSRVARKALHQN